MLATNALFFTYSQKECIQMVFIHKWYHISYSFPQDFLKLWLQFCCTQAWQLVWRLHGVCAVLLWRCPISWPHCLTAVQRESTTWRVHLRLWAATALLWLLCWEAYTSVHWVSPTPRARFVSSNKTQIITATDDLLVQVYQFKRLINHWKTLCKYVNYAVTQLKTCLINKDISNWPQTFKW